MAAVDHVVSFGIWAVADQDLARASSQLLAAVVAAVFAAAQQAALHQVGGSGLVARHRQFRPGRALGDRFSGLFVQQAGVLVVHGFCLSQRKDCNKLSTQDAASTTMKTKIGRTT